MFFNKASYQKGTKIESVLAELLYYYCSVREREKWWDVRRLQKYVVACAKSVKNELNVIKNPYAWVPVLNHNVQMHLKILVTERYMERDGRPVLISGFRSPTHTRKFFSSFGSW